MSRPVAQRLVRALLLAAALSCALTAHALIDPMPFRSGYGLGSWIEPDVVKDMKREAAMRSRIVMIDKMSSDAESVAREIALAANPVGNDQAGQQTIPPALDSHDATGAQKELTGYRQEMWRMKLDGYKKLWQYQNTQLQKLQQAGESADGDAHGAPTTFNAAIESPVNWEVSKIDYFERAFDSINVRSQFYLVDTNAQKSDSTAHARKMANAAKQSVQDLGETGNLASAVGKATANKVASTSQHHTIEYTLLLTAFATHRFTRQFKPLVTDCDKILTAWNAYVPEEGIPPPNNNMAEFLDQFYAARAKENQNQARAGADAVSKIHLVTEVFMGSSVVGMVHFVHKEGTETSQSAQTGMSVELLTKRQQLAKKMGGMSGDAAISRSMAQQLSKLASEAQLEVKFDLMSFGYIPQLEASEIDVVVKQFAEFDPAKLTPSAPADKGNTQGQSMDPNEAASVQQVSQQSNAGALIKATLMGLEDAKAKKPYKFMDGETFFKAFNDYAKAAKDTKGLGVPIGLNVRSYSRLDVFNELAEKWVAIGRTSQYNAQQAKAAGGSGTTTGGATGGAEAGSE